LDVVIILIVMFIEHLQCTYIKTNMSALQQS